MAWRRPGDKALSELMMGSLLTRIYASFGRNELVIFKLISRIYISSISCAIPLMWTPQNLTDD